jgi:hypothetical protein
MPGGRYLRRLAPLQTLVTCGFPTPHLSGESTVERSVDRPDHLRVMIANERADRLALVATIVVGLGHEVIASEVEVENVGAATARERPDVALVGLGASSEHALTLIDKIVREAARPTRRLSGRHRGAGSLPTSVTPMWMTGRAR